MRQCVENSDMNTAIGVENAKGAPNKNHIFIERRFHASHEDQDFAARC
jgi:hypothetical protein